MSKSFAITKQDSKQNDALDFKKNKSSTVIGSILLGRKMTDTLIIDGIVAVTLGFNEARLRLRTHSQFIQVGS